MGGTPAIVDIALAKEKYLEYKDKESHRLKKEKKMFDKMKELMELKKQADQIKRDLEQATLEVNEVRGIKMVITAAQTLRSVQIDETLLTKENKTRLEQDLLRSFNAAVKKSQHVAADKMKSVMPGLGNFGG